MKKLLIAVAILLMASSALAADANEGSTRESWAMGKGRAVVSDGSVVLRVWYAGSGNATVGVSDTTTIILTENGTGTSVDTSSASYDTLGEAAAYIDSLESWEASVGPDGYNGYDPYLLPSDQASAGTTEQSPTNIYNDASTAVELSVGVPATVGKFNRIKKLTHRVAGTGVVGIAIYDGDNAVWGTYISSGNYNSATSSHASPNTVDFGAKGISAAQGRSLVAVVSRATTLGDTSNKLTDCNVSIEYDQF